MAELGSTSESGDEGRFALPGIDSKGNFSNFVEGALKDIMELDFMEVASSGSSGQCSAHDRGISYNDLL